MEFLSPIKENRGNIYRMIFFAVAFTLLGLFFHEAGHYEVGEMYNLNPEFNFLVKGDAGYFKFAEVTINPDDACTEKKFYLGAIMMSFIYLLVLCLFFCSVEDRWLKFAACTAIVFLFFFLFSGLSPEGDISRVLELGCRC